MNTAKTALVSFIFSILGVWAYDHIKVQWQSQAQAGPSVVQVSRLDLVDSKGRIRAQIGFSGESSPALWFFDDKGKARVNLGVYGDQTGFLSLQDKNELSIQLLRSYGAQDTPLHIFKLGGSDRMITGLNPGGDSAEPFLMYYDKKHQRKLDFGKYDGP